MNDMKTTTNEVDLVALFESMTPEYLAEVEANYIKERAEDLARSRRYAAVNGRTQDVRGNCPRCAGSGKVCGYEHVEGGRCFRCFGTGVDGAAF